ncbi:MAG: metal-dependent hydrolase, partial [Methylococcales bacterium]|nr:metal-dependent hydrolase [Methylococcales bacterium]
MANFKVHIGVATGCSVVVTVIGVGLHFIDIQHTPWLIFLGIVGGMLPDVDAVNSRPVRLLYSILALLAAVTALSIFKKYYVESYQLLLLAVFVYCLTRYLVLASIRK